MRGFQLWSICRRREDDGAALSGIDGDRFERATPAPGVSAKVIAGKFGGISGPVTGIAIDPLYVDLRLGPGIAQELPVPAGHTAVIYVFDGAAGSGKASLPKGTLAVLGNGTRIRVTAGAEVPPCC
jgi:redox-sensitive bicupin YhaK (pirin superfamily)